MSSGMDGVLIRSIAVSPAFSSDGTIYLGTWKGVYRSRDAGATWIWWIWRIDSRTIRVKGRTAQELSACTWPSIPDGLIG